MLLSHLTLLFIAVVLFSIGCTRNKQWLQCIPQSENPRVQVSYTRGQDPIEGNPRAVRYAIRVMNGTDSDLNNVRLTINNAWSAELGQLIMYRGFREGSNIIGEGRLKAGDAIELIFSHDVSNHNLFTNSAGETMPVTTHFEVVRLDYAEGSEVFEFRRK